MEKDIVNDTLGADIKRLRKEKGMTQDELAKAVYTTWYNILRYETGHLHIASEYASDQLAFGVVQLRYYSRRC